MRQRRLSDQKLAVLDYVAANQPVRRDTLAAHMGLAEETVSGHLKRLVAMGKLQKRRIDRHRWVWEIARPVPVGVGFRPLAGHNLRAHEQVSSVWEYARRCGV